MDTHGPYEPPGEYATLYADRELSGREAQSLYQRAIDDPDSITDDERELLIDLYDAEIRYNDEQIGMFLDELRERGLLEESLVIVSADHGDAFGEHGYYEHPRYLPTDHPRPAVRPRARRADRHRRDAGEHARHRLDDRGILGEESEFSLLHPPDGDRRVFSQARGEEKHSHIRRYALRTREETCFCERDTDTGTIEHTASADPSLRSALDDHVDERVRVENGEEPDSDGNGDEGKDGDVNEEIEQRLDALGYK